MLKWINKKRNKKGFTLVELVVVIAILGILAAIAVPRFSSSTQKAAISAHNANVRTLESGATIAVSEGESNATWDGSAADKGLKYVQSWPEVPNSLIGKKFKGVTKPAEGDDPEVIGDIEIEENDIYKVVINEKGLITVTPGKIVEE